MQHERKRGAHITMYSVAKFLKYFPIKNITRGEKKRYPPDQINTKIKSYSLGVERQFLYILRKKRKIYILNTSYTLEIPIFECWKRERGLYGVSSPLFTKILKTE